MSLSHICAYEPGVWCKACTRFYGVGSSHANDANMERANRCTICGEVRDSHNGIKVYGKVSAMAEDHPQVSERLARVEITDEMVERAMKALWNNVTPFTGISPSLVNDMRRALDAALNPPPPAPEIPVTHTMLDAGYNAWGENRIPVARTSGNERWMADIYRAMRKLEPKPPESQHVYLGGSHYDGPGYTDADVEAMTEGYVIDQSQLADMAKRLVKTLAVWRAVRRLEPKP